MSLFRPITLADRMKINTYLRLYPQNEASEYTFTNLFIWSAMDHTEWYEDESLGFMLLRVSPGNAPRFLMALAKERYLAHALDKAIAVAKAEGFPFAMHSLPKWYCQLMEECFPNRFDFIHEPFLDDYIYSAEDMITLRGNKFHGQRNHINRFIRNYGDRYAYIPFTPQLAQGCLAVYEKWLAKQTGSPMLAMEQSSVCIALSYAAELAIKGGIITIDGKTEAFSLGECLNNEMAVVHIEKANPEIPQLFTMINRDFALNAFADTRWINREEDMGSEGLRRAKRSYHPVRMIEKFRATLKEQTGCGV